MGIPIVEFLLSINYVPLIVAGMVFFFYDVVAASVGIAIIRGALKSRIRLICVAISAVFSLLITLLFKLIWSFAYTAIESLVVWILETRLPQVMDFIKQSESLQKTGISIIGALLAPIIFLFVFVGLCVLSWLVYLVITLILRKKIRAREEAKKSNGRFVLTIVKGFVQGLIIFFVLVMPAYSYFRIASQVAQIALEFDEVQENEDAKNILEGFQKLENSFVVKSYSGLLGKPVSDLLIDFRVYQDGQSYKTSFAAEMPVIGNLAKDISEIHFDQISKWDESSGEQIGKLFDTVRQSKIATVVVGEVLHSLTDSWLDNQPFFGIPKPKVDETFAPLFDSLLKSFNADSRNAEQLSEDFKTVGNIVRIMAEKGIFECIGTEDEEELLRIVTQTDLLKQVTEELGKNETMKECNSELNKTGLRAIKNNIRNLPWSKEDLIRWFEMYINEIVENTNKVLQSDDQEAQIQELIEDLEQAIEENDLDIELDESTVEFFANAILEELNDRGLKIVTEEDARQLFYEYIDD